MGRRPPHKANPPPKPQAKTQQQPQPPTKTSPTSLQSMSPSSDDLAWSLYHSGALFEFTEKPKQAVACWEESEESGLKHAPTQFKLAMAHLDGLHYAADSEKALQYFQLAAAQGHGEAAAYIALFHLVGLHFPQSALNAYNLLHARAEAGCAVSTYWLSKTHLDGLETVLKSSGLLPFLPPDVLPAADDLSDDDLNAALNPNDVQFAQSDEHAVELLHKAARLGFYRAQSDLTSSYLSGLDVEPSLDKAIHWATQHTLSNPLEQYNRDKAHGSNSEIDDALDYIHGTNGFPIDYEEADELLSFAADKGYAKAFYLSALLYHHGKVEPDDEDDDLLFHLESAVRGYPEGQHRIGIEYYDNQDCESAARWFQLAADQNHPPSIDLLAAMYENGEYFPQNFHKAAELALKAAQSGHLRAQTRVARYYRDGTGVEQSCKHAAEWMIKVINTPPVLLDGTDDITKLLDSAQTMDLQQQVNFSNHELGAMYLDGQHFPQNFSAGIEHLTHAAQDGFLSSQVYLGTVFLMGDPQSPLPQDMRDDTVSTKWYTMAAHQNNTASQCRLGVHFRDGLGVEQDIAAAAEWFRKAADNGSIDAAYELGMLHYNGDHPHLVPKDTKEGLRLLTSAAEQGYLIVQTQLAIILHKTGSNGRAEKWYTAAADQGGAEQKYYLARFYLDTPEYLPAQMTAQQRDLKMVDLLSTAATMGHMYSKFWLGIIFDDGFRSIKRDSNKSRQFFVDCINDDPDVKEQPSTAAAAACLHLGYLPESTRAQVKTSLGFTTPLEWFTFGANHGDSGCQAALAQMYFEGSDGLDQDYALASYWVDKSFTQGNQQAAGLVGKMQHRGVFVRPIIGKK